MLGNKNIRPIILVQNESEMLLQMTLMKSLSRIENEVIIVLTEKERAEPVIATVGHGKLNTSFALAALALTQIASANKSNQTTIIDDRAYSERDGNLMKIYSTEYFAPPTLSTHGDILYSPKISLKKKDRKHNNRKTKKRKKAKNGR